LPAFVVPLQRGPRNRFSPLSVTTIRLRRVADELAHDWRKTVHLQVF
jgi:hypothetical protein